MQVMKLLKKITGYAPKMWGGSIVGFGTYRYRYPSGREGEWFLTGLSPRKGYLMISIMCGFEQHGALMKKLGKFRAGKSCLYVKKLEDIDLQALGELVKLSVAQMKAIEKERMKA
ncbi:MAG: DUF1801 domain-containing protein [Planctomycetes bacterium]|nr:DUF1801 domain-containing protein [Planctomycetota bacterium]MBI3847128.1 DUF1801 domain-containing protein [Planctomycetota bacterium]